MGRGHESSAILYGTLRSPASKPELPRPDENSLIAAIVDDQILSSAYPTGFSCGDRWGTKAKIPSDWMNKSQLTGSLEKKALEDDIRLVERMNRHGIDYCELQFSLEEAGQAVFKGNQDDTNYTVKADLYQCAAIERLTNYNGRWCLGTPSDSHMALLVYLDIDEKIIGYIAEIDLRHVDEAGAMLKIA